MLLHTVQGQEERGGDLFFFHARIATIEIFLLGDMERREKQNKREKPLVCVSSPLYSNLTLDPGLGCLLTVSLLYLDSPSFFFRLLYVPAHFDAFEREHTHIDEHLFKGRLSDK